MKLFSELKEPYHKLEVHLQDVQIDLLPTQLKKPVLAAITTAKTDLEIARPTIDIFQALSAVSADANFRDSLSKKICDYSEVKLSPGDVKTINSLKMLHGKIGEMEEQRTQLVDMLKNLANSPNYREMILHTNISLWIAFTPTRRRPVSLLLLPAAASLGSALAAPVLARDRPSPRTRAMSPSARPPRRSTTRVGAAYPLRLLLLR